PLFRSGSASLQCQCRCRDRPRRQGLCAAGVEPHALTTRWCIETLEAHRRASSEKKRRGVSIHQLCAHAPEQRSSRAMKTVGFIGLGVMGRPMAAHLVASSHTVKGFSRSAPTREAAHVAGIPLAESIADAVRGADVVITMLPDSPDVEQVALGEGGILEHIAAGATYIDMSTISPDSARRIAGIFSEAGHGVLDAPVSGGEAGAKEGTLSIM